jgi:predicted AlkP superfamily pyrophosphatase or phosphodiesterase
MNESHTPVNEVLYNCDSIFLSSGLYPGKHGIIGKQFYDPDIPRGTNQGRGIFFDYRDQRSTEHVNFWQQAQPIWATATEQGLKVSTYLWGRYGF